jgi:hypothetical protein
LDWVKCRSTGQVWMNAMVSGRWREEMQRGSHDPRRRRRRHTALASSKLFSTCPGRPDRSFLSISTSCRTAQQLPITVMTRPCISLLCSKRFCALFTVCRHRSRQRHLAPATIAIAARVQCPQPSFRISTSLGLSVGARSPAIPAT